MRAQFTNLSLPCTGRKKREFSPKETNILLRNLPKGRMILFDSLSNDLIQDFAERKVSTELEENRPGPLDSSYKVRMTIKKKKNTNRNIVLGTGICAHFMKTRSYRGGNLDS